MKIFTSSNGRELKVWGVTRSVIDNILNSAEYPPKPTYTAMTASGVEEVHDHDETTLATEVDKAAWKSWKAAYAKVDSAVYRHILDAFLLVGCEVDMSGIDQWKKLQSFLGIKIPENEFELQRNYIEATYLPTNDDLINLTTILMSASGADKEAVEAAKRSFRGEEQKPTIKRVKKNGRPVVDERDI